MGELCELLGYSSNHSKFDLLPTDYLRNLTSLMLGNSVPRSFDFDSWTKRQLLDAESACSLTYVEVGCKSLRISVTFRGLLVDILVRPMNYSQAQGSDLDVTFETMHAVRRCRKDVRLDFNMMD